MEGGGKSDHQIFGRRRLKDGLYNCSEIFYYSQMIISNVFLCSKVFTEAPFNGNLVKFGCRNTKGAGDSDLTPPPPQIVSFHPLMDFLCQNYTKSDLQQILYCMETSKKSFLDHFRVSEVQFSKLVRSDPRPFTQNKYSFSMLAIQKGSK